MRNKFEVEKETIRLGKEDFKLVIDAIKIEENKRRLKHVIR